MFKNMFAMVRDNQQGISMPKKIKDSPASFSVLYRKDVDHFH